MMLLRIQGFTKKRLSFHDRMITRKEFHVWQEQNARIFAGMSRTSNLVFNQIECIIRDKLDLMKLLPCQEMVAHRIHSSQPFVILGMSHLVGCL
jgi:hypothetical protein